MSISNLRFDKGVIKSKHLTSDGFLKVDAIITRTGVFKYRNNDGSIRNELRHPDEILKADSLESIQLIPITLDHPKERTVTPENARSLSRGFVGEKISHDGRLIKANIVVTDKEAINAIESGIQELSLGYQTVLVQDSGEYNGERFDYRQTEVKYNHLAIVSSGRAGEARILLDSADAEMCEDSFNSNQSHKETNMKLVPITLDGIIYEVQPEVQRALEKSTKLVADSTSELQLAKDTASALQAKLDVSAEEIEKLKKIDHSDSIKEAVQSRLSLLTVALKHLDAEESKDIEVKSDSDIKVAVIKKYSPDVNLDGKDPAYIQARFDVAIENTPEPGISNIGKQKQQTSNGTTKIDSIDSEASRKAYVESLTTAWKQKI